MPSQLLSGPRRALLAYHGIGTGKTCVGVRTVEHHVRRRPEGPRGPVVIMCPREAIEREWKKALDDTEGCVEGGKLRKSVRTVVFGTMRREARNMLGKDWDDDIIDQSIRNRYAGALLLVDEIHMDGFFAKECDGDDEGDSRPVAISTYVARIGRVCPDARLLAMTATPAYDKVDLVYQLVDFLRDFDGQSPSFARSEDRVPLKLTEAARGYVSYVRGEDPSTFPVRLAPGKGDFPSASGDDGEIVRSALTRGQIAALAELNGTRKAVPSKIQGILTVLPPKDASGGGWLRPQSIARHSPLFHTILQQIEGAAPEESGGSPAGIVLVTFVYHRSASLFCEALDAHGYTRKSKAGTAVKAYRGYVSNSKRGKSTQISTKMMRLINSPDNRHGRRARIVVATGALLTGVNFKNVRQVHIAESWWNVGRVEQAIGRAFRRLSHRSLPPPHRNVVVFQHQCVDEASDGGMDGRRQFAVAKKKHAESIEALRALRAAAFDCDLQADRTNADYRLAVQARFPDVVDVFGVRREPLQDDAATPTPVACDANATEMMVGDIPLRPGTVVVAVEVMAGVFRIYADIAVRQLITFTRLLARTALDERHAEVSHYSDELLLYAARVLIESREPVVDPMGRLAYLVANHRVIRGSTIVSCVPDPRRHRRFTAMSTTPAVKDWITAVPTEGGEASFERLRQLIELFSKKAGVMNAKVADRYVVESAVERMPETARRLCTELRRSDTAGGRWDTALKCVSRIRIPDGDVVREYRWDDRTGFVETDVCPATTPTPTKGRHVTYLHNGKLRVHEYGSTARYYDSIDIRSRPAKFRSAYDRIFKSGGGKGRRYVLSMELAFRAGLIPSYKFVQA